MSEKYKFVYIGGSGELTEKKSRFIATVEPASTEEEAMAFIERIRKQFWDASHNCTAFTIGSRHELTRCSDDGEPAGTAGRPMLDVLLGEDIHNAAVVVTRYFGGTLLGTGGLVRAYSGAVREGLQRAVVLEKRRAVRLDIQTDYNGIGKIQYLLGQAHIPILNSEYTDCVNLQALVPCPELDALTASVTESTNGRAILSPGDECWYALMEDKAILFEEGGL